MGCFPESCNYRRALGVAQELVAANEANLLSDTTRKQKLAELAVSQLIFDKVAPECPGQKEDGTCGSVDVINNARGFIFGTPAVEISARDPKNVGFTL